MRDHPTPGCESESMEGVGGFWGGLPWRGSRLAGAVAPHDPHREELRAAAVGVAERGLRAPSTWCSPAWPRTCIAASAKRSMPEAPIGFDDSTPPDMLTGISPSSAVAPSSVIFQPSPSGAKPRFSIHIGSNQRERHVDLGAVDLLARIRDAGLRVQLRRRSRVPRLRVHLVAAREHRRLAAHRRRRAPTPACAAPSSRASSLAEHHRARAVRRRAGLEVADRVPQHRRVRDLSNVMSGIVQVRVRVLERVLPVLHRDPHADVLGRARARGCRRG